MSPWRHFSQGAEFVAFENFLQWCDRFKTFTEKTKSGAQKFAKIQQFFPALHGLAGPWSRFRDVLVCCKKLNNFSMPSFSIWEKFLSEAMQEILWNCKVAQDKTSRKEKLTCWSYYCNNTVLWHWTLEPVRRSSGTEPPLATALNSFKARGQLGYRGQVRKPRSIKERFTPMVRVSWWWPSFVNRSFSTWNREIFGWARLEIKLWESGETKFWCSENEPSFSHVQGFGKYWLIS